MTQELYLIRQMPVQDASGCHVSLISYRYLFTFIDICIYITSSINTLLLYLVRVRYSFILKYDSHMNLFSLLHFLYSLFGFLETLMNSYKDNDVWLHKAAYGVWACHKTTCIESEVKV